MNNKKFFEDNKGNKSSMRFNEYDGIGNMDFAYKPIMVRNGKCNPPIISRSLKVQ